ncbi:histone-like nucleoid-structuring protein Lsr2 [Clavibacter zhangzhiyongii]|uniref:Lsr2 dimerization domain-containing protein n=2 Tax=Clavibacter zhangzhiyongii TaxID=2768071 RepID=UPI0039DFB955
MTEHVDPRGDDRLDEATETVRFGLDGIVHEIDLDATAARELRDALAPYVAAGRRTAVTITPIRDDAATPGPGAGTAPGSAPTGERAAARAWLEANGHRLGPGGRISATLMTLYRGRDGR